MKVNIVAVNQKYSLDTGEVFNSLLLVLRDGTQLEIKVNEEQTAAIVAASAKPAPPGEEEEELEPQNEPPGRYTNFIEEPDGVAPESFPDAPPATDAEMIHWPSLDSNLLSPDIRAILVENDLPALMEATQFMGLVQKLAEQLAEIEESNAVTLPPGPARAPTQLQTTPFRTVAKDEAGNPVVPRGNSVSRAPVGVADEDGVPQL